MVKGYTEVEEDDTIEEIKRSVLAKKVGKYNAKTFLGKVNRMCQAASQPVQYNIEFEPYVDRISSICTM